MCSVAINIAGLTFRLYVPGDVRQDAELTPFVVENGPADITVSYREDPAVPQDTADISPDGKQVVIGYNPDIAGHFTALRGCLIHLPMEQLLLMHQRFFLHASFVTSPWGGLLFTADSGVGKSTQAELWRQHRGSRIINGDRVILAKEETWRGYGSPYAGSSGYYINESQPIGAIILLEQGRENRVTPVSPPEAFRCLLLQSAMESQSARQVDELCDLLMDLIAAVPVYRLSCTPDVGAVDALAAVLEKGRAS